MGIGIERLNIEKIRKKAKSEPLGFELLPKYFTLPQLQNLYECIYDTEFDSRNFRKKILSAPSAQKARVLLSRKKISPRLQRKCLKEGGDHSKW